MTARPARQPHVVTAPTGVDSMSLTEIAAELRADRLTLEQAHAVLGPRTCLDPSWRPGDEHPGSAASPLSTTACPTCGAPRSPK